MTCCNQRRAQLASRPARAASRAVTTSRSPAPPAAGQPSAPPPGTSGGASGTDGAQVQLRFTGSRRVRIEGVISGRIYRASPAAPLLTAHQEDVRSLLRTGYFVRH